MTTPSHPVRRFACVSDRDEFHELVTDVPATLTWFMTPRPGFDASERQAFELQFSGNSGSTKLDLVISGSLLRAHTARSDYSRGQF